MYSENPSRTSIYFAQEDFQGYAMPDSVQYQCAASASRHQYKHGRQLIANAAFWPRKSCLTGAAVHLFGYQLQQAVLLAFATCKSHNAQAPPVSFQVICTAPC